MLRASSQGLSFAFPTARLRAIRPWNVAYSIGSQMRSLDGGSRLSTSGRVPVGGINRTQEARWTEGYSSRLSSVQTALQSQVPARVPVVEEERVDKPSSSLSTETGTGGRKTWRKARNLLAQRIRSLRAVPQRFARPRLETRRPQRRSVCSPEQQALLHQQQYNEYPPFHHQTGKVDPIRLPDGYAAGPLNAIEAACASQNEPSPSSAIFRDLTILSRSTNLQQVWNSYRNISRLQACHPAVEQHFPPSRLPRALVLRLAHFILRSRPVTAAHYPALLAVMQHLWDLGTPPSQSLWNGLIGIAGKGQRRGGTGKEGTKRSIAIFRDFVKGLRPGTSQGEYRLTPETFLDPNLPNKPDIYTLSILLHIASETINAPMLRDATRLIKRSGLTPTRITLLSYLEFFSKKHQLQNVRAINRRLHRRGMELGLDGANACISAYASNRKYHIALEMYRILRHNIKPEPKPKFVARLRTNLELTEHIYLPKNVGPDRATFTVLVQNMAYNGRFNDAVSILADFLESSSSQRISANVSPALRGMFLGFSKFAVGRLQVSADPNNRHNQWNLTNLQQTYQLFLKLPYHVVPSRATIYWILVAFDKASDHDVDCTRRVWLELERRFGHSAPWLLQQPRLRRIRSILFPREHG